MRYIKLFEDINNGYERINDIPFFKNQPFTQSEVRVLLEKGAKVSNFWSYTYILNVSIDGNPITIHICRDNDEWYYIESAAYYYKCDQFDGLLNCLKNECGIE